MKKTFFIICDICCTGCSCSSEKVLEQNGIHLTEMNIAHLKKVEEIYLVCY